MTPEQQEALRVAESIDPDYYWNGFKLDVLARALDEAKVKGAAEAEAALRPMLDTAVNCAERSASLAEHAAKRAWHAMLAAFGLAVYLVLQLVMK